MNAYNCARKTTAGVYALAVIAVAVTTSATSATAAKAEAGTRLSVAIAEPVENTVFDRGVAAVFEAAGAVEFDTPVPDERTYYAGQVDDPGNLRPKPTGESGRRAWQGSFTPFNELSDEPEQTVFATTVMDRVPFTLDASRPLSGVVTHVGLVDWRGSAVEGTGAGSGVGWTEIDISVSAEDLDGAWRTLGSTSVSYIATPARNTYQESWSIELPAELDKADFGGKITLTLVVRGYNAGHGFTVPDDTNFTVPIYSTSFDRRVEIAVDDGSFSDENVTVSNDRTMWTATIPTPGVGTHTVKVRAAQGWESREAFNGWVSARRTSPTATRTITVTG